MEIKTSKKALKTAISLAKKALAKIVIQEERGHLLFRVEGDKLKVSSTNNDLKALCIVDIENTGDDNFSFTADPKILEKLLTKMDIDTVRMEYDSSDLVLKIYTTATGKSFTSVQSFPTDKMLTFNEDLGDDVKEYPVDREVLVHTLDYAKVFLSPIKEDSKQFDFIIFNKGIVFAANGYNKMGFIVFKAYETMENFKVRKAVVPFLLSFVDSIKEHEHVVLFETPKEVGVYTQDKSTRYSFLKSNVEPPDIPTNRIKSEGPFTLVDKDALIKVLDRLVVSRPTAKGSGIEISLKGAGEDSYIDLGLVSNLKVTERFDCARVNDESPDEVSHVVDYVMFKSILSSFEAKKQVRLHINDESKFYKVYNSGEINGNKYISAALGGYSKVINNG